MIIGGSKLKVGSATAPTAIVSGILSRHIVRARVLFTVYGTQYLPVGLQAKIVSMMMMGKYSHHLCQHTDDQ